MSNIEVIASSFCGSLLYLPAIVRLRRTPQDYARERQARRAGIRYSVFSSMCRDHYLGGGKYWYGGV